MQIAVHANLYWCYFWGFSNVIWKSVLDREPGIWNKIKIKQGYLPLRNSPKPQDNVVGLKVSVLEGNWWWLSDFSEFSEVIEWVQVPPQNPWLWLTAHPDFPLLGFSVSRFASGLNWHRCICLFIYLEWQCFSCGGLPSNFPIAPTLTDFPLNKGKTWNARRQSSDI